MTILKQIVDALAKLSTPATVTTAVAVLVEVLSPFGVHMSGQAVAGILGGIGAVAALVERYLPAVKAKLAKKPA